LEISSIRLILNASFHLPRLRLARYPPFMQATKLRSLIIATGMVGSLSLTACGPQFFRASYSPLAIRVEVEKPKPPKRKIIKISDRVQFRTNSAKLLRKSHKVLDEVVAVLKKNPKIEQVEIQGHTDNVGSVEHNEKLSAARAESVKRYLMKKGIEETRLSTKGHGPHKPIADNGTKEGRTQNRRVEFEIRKQGS
jgi:outer membrane protein OmpA-like peptidoglycan-associated protein